jgi:hypothetical protein
MDPLPISVLRRVATRVLPLPARRFLGRKHQGMVFRRAMREFLRDPQASLAPESTVISRLIYGWGNAGWSAAGGYLRACLRHGIEAEQPILECGSGLTTLLLGAIAQNQGNTLWSLEHHAEWAQRVREQLAAFGILGVRLCVGPLESYGEFSWYKPPLDTMPAQFALVICDGPPGQTPGGRYGLVPIMKARLPVGAVILLDDARRPHERETAARWVEELGASCEIVGSERPFARLHVTGKTPPPSGT